MSLINSIANFRKPIGSGISRNAYYSKKYNVVVKIGRRNDVPRQSINEKTLFDIMTKREKEVFPIVQVLEYKGKLCIVMKKCTPVSDRTFINYRSTKQICDELGIDPSNNATIARMGRKYGLCDLHTGNLGIDENNRLVVLDGGLINS